MKTANRKLNKIVNLAIAYVIIAVIAVVIFISIDSSQRAVDELAIVWTLPILMYLLFNFIYTRFNSSSKSISVKSFSEFTRNRSLAITMLVLCVICSLTWILTMCVFTSTLCYISLGLPWAVGPAINVGCVLLFAALISYCLAVLITACYSSRKSFARLTRSAKIAIAGVIAAGREGINPFPESDIRASLR